MPRHETEIKLRVCDARAVRRRIIAQGFAVLEPRRREQNFLFDFPDLRLRKAGMLIRLRLEKGRNLITFKGPPVKSARYKIRREIETEVEDGARFREILEFLGLRQVFCYEKFRITYAPHQRRISGAGLIEFDQTPIGDFLELEGPRRWIDATASRLGFGSEDYVTQSYVALYFARCKAEGARPGNMVFAARK